MTEMKNHVETQFTAFQSFPVSDSGLIPLPHHYQGMETEAAPEYYPLQITKPTTDIQLYGTQKIQPYA